MAVEAVSESGHQALAFTWDKGVVEGEQCEIWADNPADQTEMAFKKKALNDGEGVLMFPSGYSGTCSVEVRGDNDSKDEGSLAIGEPAGE